VSKRIIQKKRDKAKSRRLRYLVLLAVVVIAIPSLYLIGEYGLPFGSYLSNSTRQAATVAGQNKWARRIGLPGLPNFYKASDELYRGAQPTAEGMEQLEKLGVKTVVNLRALHSDRDELKGTDLSYVHIGMTAWCISDNDVIRFLRVVTDPNRTPVFVHCQHGADRTGAMCASYRVVVQGWSKEEAIKEMTKGGFGFHYFWQNLPKLIRKLDVQKIKEKAGLVGNPI
jgi:tyrosine-protein phosphatase SIW14